MTQNVKPTLLVLAAGIGSRFGGLKQIRAVGPAQESIVDYSVYDAVRAGFGQIVFVIRQEIEADFRATVGRNFEERISVEYVYQDLKLLPAGFRPPLGRTRPWGTGHAVWVARRTIQEPFAAINADDFYGLSAYKLLADFLRGVQDPHSNEYAMIGFVLRNTLSEFGTVSRGICQLDGDSYLQRVVELRQVARDGAGATYVDDCGQLQPLTGCETVSMNMWGFAPSIFNHLEDQFVEFLARWGGQKEAEFFIPTVVDRLIAEGRIRVGVFPSRDSWFGITYQEDHAYVAKRIRNLVDQDIYPDPLWD